MPSRREVAGQVGANSATCWMADPVSYNILYVPDDVLDRDFYADSDEKNSPRQFKPTLEKVSRPVAEIDTRQTNGKRD